MPPEPSSSWPFIGHLHLLGRLPHISLGELADKYGPIFMINLGVKRTLVVSSGEMAKECLGGTNGNIFANRPIKSIVKLVTYNAAMFVFSQYGQYWGEQRKIAIVEILSNHRIEMFKDVRISEVRSAIKVLYDNCQITELSPSGSASVDMSEWLKDLSLNIILKLISGKTLKESYQGEEYTRCTKANEDFFQLAAAFVPADAVPFLRWFDFGGYEKEMKRVAKEMDRVPQRWLE
uniref:Cytochrome P450 n=1 Tax=Chenopodium quinoa TaxID=63459 RepID=A0A803NB98_CHEQI